MANYVNGVFVSVMVPQGGDTKCALNVEGKFFLGQLNQLFLCKEST